MPNTCQFFPQKFFYRLGHCPELSVFEFINLTKTQNIIFNQKWLISDENLDVKHTGGLVFGGEILAEFTGMQEFKQEFAKIWGRFLLQHNADRRFKKIGFAGPRFISDKVIQIGKKNGVQKINLLVDQQPNFGHLKGWTNWFIVLGLQSKFYLGWIKSFCNQEFWTQLDKNLPCSDMARGQINLKLGRSLLNLASNSTIWDPLAGIGRITIAGLDLDKTFLNSDKDPSCLPQAEQNLEWAKIFWRHHNSDRTINQAISDSEPGMEKKSNFWPLSNNLPLTLVFVSDITNFQLKNLPAKVNWTETSVVTEGYLGQNFKTNPSPDQMLTEFTKVLEMWDLGLANLAKLGIPEIVFCLPYYNRQINQPKIVLDLVTKHGYLIQNYLHNPNHQSNKPIFLDIIYTRQTSRVGHWIFKLSRRN